MKMREFGLNLVRESRRIRHCEGAKRPKQTINQKMDCFDFLQKSCNDNENLQRKDKQ